ncbi:hypothetical protein [Thermostaphylospora chromogena]|uniref:Uncharacterized protein n=1 Tax=Thermostaphylospora chromogena TaxID=35622 RepID=A0A1H1FRG8_9ACTN|nr:hypothetical protein [Thermostaphylospora chromogena]SDR03592.1 hypothetical protein SAMN04489764_3140 [Thermostaphylospora chromogena]
MTRTRWRLVAGVMALSGGVFLTAGSAALAEPPSVPQGDLELRLVVDDCPRHSSAVQP